MAVIELSAKPSQKNHNPEVLGSVAVVGAAGQVGKYLTENLAPFTPMEAVVRNRRWRDKHAFPQVNFHSSIEEMLRREPGVVILATPNPVKEVLEEIAEHVQRPLTLVLPQNGVQVVGQAKEVLSGIEGQVSLVRASLFTNITRTEDGELITGRRKKIALAPINEDRGGVVSQLGKLFTQAGFDTRLMEDYLSMEYSKLLANLFGATSTVTGLPPREAFMDPKIFDLERRAMRDRLRILRAAGIKADPRLWNINQFKLLAALPTRMPELIALRFRKVTAEKMAAERGNQLPAAARRINEGDRSVESANYYHKAIVELGARHNLRSPVDEAMIDILDYHERTTRKFSLVNLDTTQRSNLLQEVSGYATKELFVKDSRVVRFITERVIDHYCDSLTIVGRNNLDAVTEVLEAGQCVLLAPNHRAHPDHATLMMALRQALPHKARRYPVYILAGMKFEKEKISGTLQRAYPHPIIYTLTNAEDEDDRWRAQIINRRGEKVVEDLLGKPCIFVAYLEGGRSQTVVNGKVQLQKAALGGSAWVLNSRIGLTVPTTIQGTEIMLPYGTNDLHHADVNVCFCPPIKNDILRERALAISRTDKSRDTQVSGWVMREIAAGLPEDARGVWRLNS